jgi:hypothetical protein
MKILLGCFILIIAFVFYRKYVSEKILKEIKKRYEFSISNAIKYKLGNLDMKFSSSRIYFLENEIINFNKSIITEVEQIVVPDSGKTKRKGVLKGNYYELKDMDIKDGKSEIKFENELSNKCVLRIDSGPKETEILRKWKEKYFKGLNETVA